MPPRGGVAPEATVLAAARQGDLRAWAWIVRRHQELIYRSTYLATRDSGPAEAATKDAFMRAYRSLPSLPPGAALRPWLMGIGDTAARTRLREMSQRRDDRVPEPDPCPRLAPTPVRLAPGMPTPTRLEHDALVDAFDGLIDSDRNTIAARYAFGLGRDEAATRLGVEAPEVDERLRVSAARLRSRTAEAIARAKAPDPDGRSRASGGVLEGNLSLTDDQLGSMVMAAVVSELPWTPDVVPAVCARLAREAVAYPETRATAPESGGPPVAGESTAARGPSEVSTPRGVSTLRGIGLLAGIGFIGLAFAVSAGAASSGGWGLAADVRSAISGSLGRADAVPQVEADAASPAMDGMPAPGTVAVGTPAVEVSPAPGAVAVGTPAVEVSPAPDRVSASPAVSIVGATWRENGVLTAVVRVDRQPDDQSPVSDRARLERKVGKRGWQAFAWTDAAEPLLAVLAPDRTYRFRVRAIDAAGDEIVSDVTRVELTVRGPRSSRLRLSRGDWAQRRSPSGWRRLVATAAGATARTTFSGSDVAVVGPVGRSLDAIGVRIDGGAWIRDPQAFGQSRPVLFSQDLDEGRHSLDIRAEDGRLAVDAILILRSPRT